MNKYSLLLAMLIASAVPSMAEDEATQLTIGTYNVRFRTLGDKTDDEATNKYWDARADNVIRTIKEMNTDVMSINEVTDDSSVDGRTMLNDLKTGLPSPDWGFITADNIPNNHTASTVHTILYKPDVLEPLEQGKFYHAPDINTYYSEVWDEGNKARMALWVKFRVRATGEIFYFTETHLHHTGNIAKNEGSRINVEQMVNIAGKYPVFICGDHNCTPTRLPFYEMHTAYFDDSRAVATTTDGSNGTCNVWNSTSLSRLDYVWVRGAKVSDYRTIQEKYDKSFYPSDHFPLVVKITLNKPLENLELYVDANAAEGGDGSISAPFANLQDAIDKADNGATIRMATGTYLPTYRPDGSKYTDRDRTFNVTKSVFIIGGYDNKFANIEGRSVLSGDLEGNDVYNGDGTVSGNEENVYSVLTAVKGSALNLTNIEVCGGNAKATTGAGINSKGPRVVLDNVYVHHNNGKGTGAGVYSYGQIIADSCMFVANTTSGIGGAVYCDATTSTMWWRHHFRNCLFEKNKAFDGAAVYIKSNFWTNFVGNAFIDNTVTTRGTVHLTGNTIESQISFYNNTFANNTMQATTYTSNTTKGGSAIYIDNMIERTTTTDLGAQVALTNNTIVGNSCICDNNGTVPEDFVGAAVMIVPMITLYLNNNIIAGNYTSAASGTGDIYLANNEAIYSANTKYNVYGAASGISFTKKSTDYVCDDEATARTNLANALDVYVENDRVIAKPAYNGGRTPTIAIINPTYGSTSLNSLKAARFVETTVKTDLNYDVQITSNNSNPTDQRGFKRTMTADGSASYGAYEYGSVTEVKDIVCDSREVSSAYDGYYNLQGIRVPDDNLMPGIYIHRSAGKASKVLIR